MHISLRNCDIRNGEDTIMRSVSLTIKEGEHWLVTGPNGSGKSALVAALSGSLQIEPGNPGEYIHDFSGSTAFVSLEAAAALIEEERRNDDSDFVEGGVDAGRTPRRLILESLPADEAARFPLGAGLEGHPDVLACGIAGVLDRGLKYLSTGEIRRTVLCRALASKPRLILLDDPFDGLDAASREKVSLMLNRGIPGTQYIVAMDDPRLAPESITNVLELEALSISFAGTKAEYESSPAHITPAGNGMCANSDTGELSLALDSARERSLNALPDSARTDLDVLIEMKNVTVEWSERKVLDRLSWTLRRGEHWLIRGPNGSGKTTFLELITGDNPQVFRNEVWLFGSRRGSGETIWEIKEKMGIVSYRLHTEYRLIGDSSLETVLLSGIHDSIGLYAQCGEEERALAAAWLSLAGFAGRERDLFRDLSYGEQRAILIARAAIKQPPLLILDEPCHGLDSAHRTRILALLEKIAESGASTLLHVTHDPTEILPCERRILELRPGETPMYRIIERGSAAS